MKPKAIILLSGGLDSAVSLAKCVNEYDIELALFFDYGQKSLKYEKISSEKLANFYGVRFEAVSLPWLKDITNTSLVNENAEIPSLTLKELDEKEITENSMKNVWISNRNALFLNIAAAYCDSFGFKKIIIGANKEEAQTFSDNSADFIARINEVFKYSTLVKPKVIAPLIDFEKDEIIKLGYDLKLPFDLIRSCYSSEEFHCGKCESCLRLKRGLERLGLFDILNVLFR